MPIVLDGGQGRGIVLLYFWVKDNAPEHEFLYESLDKFDITDCFWNELNLWFRVRKPIFTLGCASYY